MLWQLNPRAIAPGQKENRQAPDFYSPKQWKMIHPTIVALLKILTFTLVVTILLVTYNQQQQNTPLLTTVTTRHLFNTPPPRPTTGTNHNHDTHKSLPQSSRVTNNHDKNSPSFIQHAIPFDDKKKIVFDPNLLLYHHTRYNKGCFSTMKSDYQYSHIVPFVYNFDTLVTNCNIDWLKRLENATGHACIYNTNRRTHQMTRFLHDLHIHPDITYVHVRSWQPSLTLFIKELLPSYEQQGKFLIVHTGSEDYSTSYETYGKRILESKYVLRWVIEQTIDPEISRQRKVIQMPIGLCVRELISPIGEQLCDVARRSVFQSTTSEANATKGGVSTPITPQSQHPMDALPFKQRLDRIFICFHEAYDNRHHIAEYGRTNCTVCDVCNTSMNHHDLWMTYTQYKYVVAPYGNGVDCFRNTEIILFGSIPVIQYFEGAKGYADAGMKVVYFHDVNELNAENVKKWSTMFDSSSSRELVTRAYWNRRAFQWTQRLPKR